MSLPLGVARLESGCVTRMFDRLFEMPQIVGDPLSCDPTDQWRCECRGDLPPSIKPHRHVLGDNRLFSSSLQTIIDLHAHHPLLDLHPQLLIWFKRNDLARRGHFATAVAEPLLDLGSNALLGRSLMLVFDHLRHPLQNALGIVQPGEDDFGSRCDRDMIAGLDHGVSRR